MNLGRDRALGALGAMSSRLGLAAWVALLVLAASLVTLAAAWIAASQLIKPARTSLGSPPSGAIAVEFVSQSGARLRGWLFPVAGPRGAVALMHGVRGNRADMISRARFSNSLGYAALAFDFQAHGESEGAFITFGDRESADAQAAVAYLARKYPATPVFALGVSLGGAAALLASPPLQVDGMILEAVYPDISTAVSNRLAMRMELASVLTPLLTAQLGPRLGMATERLAPARAARTSRVPILVMSGSRDRHTTIEDTCRLYEAIPTSKRLVIIDGAGHEDLLAYDAHAYTEAVRNFLAGEQHAGPTPPVGPSSRPVAGATLCE